MRKKLVGKVKFANGSYYRCFLMGNLPSLAKEANDYIYLEISPEQNRGEKEGYYMNIYDANNLIWVLTSAILAAQEVKIDHLPKKEVEERLLR